MISVFITTENCFLREGVKNILQGRQEIKILGESSSCQETVCSLQKIRPDILLIDVEACWGKHGMRFLNEVKQIHSNTRILLLGSSVGN